MTNYYYLVPSLPSIKSDGDSNMSLEAFLEVCKGCITKKDYAILEKVATSDEVVKGNAFVEAYTRFRHKVEMELASQRAAKLGIKAGYENTEEKENLITNTVKKAVNEESPLEGEKILLSLYFDFLDKNVGSGHNYDLTFLISYALKLKLLGRKAAFTPEKGRAEFEKLFGTLKNQIYQ